MKMSQFSAQMNVQGDLSIKPRVTVLMSNGSNDNNLNGLFRIGVYDKRYTGLINNVYCV